ncbi:hypothetical protein [Weissella tructae]|uniref:hypothetical protein n=1 Tax=Weissella tructae TaxID=887702 RepID=UPI001BDD9934|nr:hypothetical protein [Weissella tructae]QVV90862.1 hypothetical protein KHQ32_04305 [Weissella tructae]
MKNMFIANKKKILIGVAVVLAFLLRKSIWPLLLLAAFGGIIYSLFFVFKNRGALKNKENPANSQLVKKMWLILGLSVMSLIMSIASAPASEGNNADSTKAIQSVSSEKKATSDKKATKEQLQKQVDDVNKWYEEVEKPRISKQHADGDMYDEQYENYEPIRGFVLSGSNILVKVSTVEINKNNYSKKDVATAGFNALQFYPKQLTGFDNINNDDNMWSHYSPNSAYKIEHFLHLD